MSAQNTSSIGLFYKSVGRLWRVSDCEELVGAILGVMGLDYCIVPDELYLIKKMSFSPKFVFPSNPPKVVPVT